MHIIPAIDLKDGRCVRLLRGDFDAVTDYTDDIVGLALAYAEAGCRWLHVVDLDGAASGNPANRRLLQDVVERVDISVQTGGGIRSEDDLERLFDCGVDRAVIGSVAVTKTDTVRAWLDRFGPERLVVALDVATTDDGRTMVMTHGWTKASGLSLSSALGAYGQTGLRHVLCTDIDRDGVLGGPNTALYAKLAAEWPRIEFQASGGVSMVADLDALSHSGAAAAITGKALLEGRITLTELAECSRNA